ncbi:addiction module antidote protein, HigA family [Solimonas aquatica]|uniref:Addiction module antidote protein, HigA family n=1 Tax=Solimonas aquatica TaxID=489703 RepID=A0A1H9FZI8_9GAMM|nr:HigA family addiction module antitoxin [Solimonas aquatica]SEQ42878.1 addiction module antidote protein, HigA family [Solimonas aquatica]
MMKPQLPQRHHRTGVPTRTPVHPGHLLEKLFLVPLGMNQTEAASRLGVSRRRLHEVVRGRRALTPDTAARCALHFGADAQFWLVLQAQHDAFLATRRLQSARS